MAIVDQEIQVYVGEAVTLPFTMSPVEDVSGWSIRLTVARAAGAARKLIAVDAEILDGPDGTFRFELASADTDLLPAEYAYDVWRTDAGNERLLAIGPFLVSGDVANPSV